MDPELITKNVETYFGDNLNWSICAIEAHKDGTPHVHAVVALKKRHDSRDMSCFDCIAGKHGNYQVVNSKRATIEYVMKGGNYHARGIDPVAFIKACDKKIGRSAAYVADLVKQGKTLKEIDEELPAFVLMNRRKIVEYMEWWALLKAKDNLCVWPMQMNEELKYSKEDKQIGLWLADRVRKPMKMGEKHLYIYGGTGLGKTSLADNLSQALLLYFLPHSKWYDGFDPEVVDLLIMDEFRGQKTIQELNQLLDGKLQMEVKGSYIMQRKVTPVIFFSNYPLEEVYATVAEKQPEKLETLKRRVVEVNVKSRIQLFWNCTQIKKTV